MHRLQHFCLLYATFLENQNIFLKGREGSYWFIENLFCSEISHFLPEATKPIARFRLHSNSRSFIFKSFGYLKMISAHERSYIRDESKRNWATIVGNDLTPFEPAKSTKWNVLADRLDE